MEYPQPPRTPPPVPAEPNACPKAPNKEPYNRQIRLKNPPKMGPLIPQQRSLFLS